MYKYNYAVIATLALMGVMSGCKEEPYVDADPVSEEYTRAFVMKFGLIDEKQDWNAAAPSTLTLYPQVGGASGVDIFVKACDSYYLAARYDDVTAASKLNFEIPDGITELHVAVDGHMYTCAPGSTLDLRGASRAGEEWDDEETPEPEYNTPPTDFNNLGWLMCAEDLGTIGDFDFNDFIARIEYDVTSASFSMDALDWAGDDNNVGISKAPSRAAADVKLHITAMAAGGTLPIWLHYVAPDSKDYVISPNAENGYILASEMGDDILQYEWHAWFGAGHNIMVNTSGTKAKGREVVLPGAMLPDGFIFGDYSHTDSSSDENTIKGFYIEVGALNGTRISAPRPGGAPQMFLIPDIGWRTKGSYVSGWLWPVERTGIDSAYGKFRDWVGTPEAHADWYTQTKGADARDVYHRTY